MGSTGKMGRALTELILEDPQLELATDEEGDVVIDFSSPEGTKKAIGLKKPLVCGTTGLSKKIWEDLESLSKEKAVLYSPNFSLGMALCFAVVQQIKMQMQKNIYLNQGIEEIQLQEVHHIQKKDTPSGTSLRLAELLEIAPTTIESTRKEDVVGIHQVNFLFSDERVSLRHEALSRRVFAQGALLAAKFLLNKPPKLYTIQDLFR